MTYVLRLESIGDNWRYLARNIKKARPGTISFRDEINAIKWGGSEHSPWCARLSLDINGSMFRRFLNGAKSYMGADKQGEHGIYLYCYLEDGVYEVNEPTALGKSARYYIKVSGDLRTIISKEVVLECLKNT